MFKPKPMIEIGGMPILWHIMKEYVWYGHNEFIICAGYKAFVHIYVSVTIHTAKVVNFRRSCIV